MADFDRILQDLERVRRSGRQLEIFGGSAHHFESNPRLAEHDLLQFETRHKIHLPADYREYLLQVGNGGAGPAYGVFRLGEMDDGFGFMPWESLEGFVGDLRKPLPYTAAWNDLTGMPPAEGLSDEAHDAQLEAFDRVYYHPLDGAFPICHRGCALRDWLVVSGAEYGNVWQDDRADYNGLSPFILPGLNRVTFLQWYRAWLDEALQQTGNE